MEELQEATDEMDQSSAQPADLSQYESPSHVPAHPSIFAHHKSSNTPLATSLDPVQKFLRMESTGRNIFKTPTGHSKTQSTVQGLDPMVTASSSFQHDTKQNL